MNKLVNNLVLNWKSTASGFLTISLVVTGTLLTTPNLISAKHTAVLIALQSIAKGWVALIQQDSGKTLAAVPGQAPTVVDSHEVPDNPDAIPVSGDK